MTEGWAPPAPGQTSRVHLGEIHLDEEQTRRLNDRQGKWNDPVIYRGGDPFKLRERFDNPDYTDRWREPSIGDDLTKNSGRYPRYVGYGPRRGWQAQYLPDKYVLEARLGRLKTIENIKQVGIDEHKIHRAAAEAAYEGMYESCLNDGQRAILKRLKFEIIGQIVSKAPSFSPSMEFEADPYEESEFTEEEGGSGSGEEQAEESEWESVNADQDGYLKLDPWMDWFGMKVQGIVGYP